MAVEGAGRLSRVDQKEDFGDKAESSEARTRPIHVGMIVGNEHDRALERKVGQAIKLTGNNDINKIIDMIDRSEVVTKTIHLTPSYFRKSIRHDISKVDVFWNRISDADLNPELIAVADRFVRQSNRNVIDAPANMSGSRRHRVSEKLASLEGVRMPKTLLLRMPDRHRVARQLAAVDFRFPAILRAAGTHSGEIVALIDDIDGASPIFGDRKNEYYITEFVDVRGSDDLYRKSRFFVVGDRIIVRQHIIAKNWNIHGASSREYMVHHPELLDEARKVLIGQVDSLKDETLRALHLIRDTMDLEYFGIDACVMPDGSLTVFEANATMNFNPTFRNPATQYNRAALAPMVEAVRRLLVAKAAKRR